MHPPTISRTCEQRHPASRCVLDSNKHRVTIRKTFSFRSVARKFSGCSCFHDGGEYLRSRAETGIRRKPCIFPGGSHSIDDSARFPVLGVREGQTNAGRRSLRQLRKQAVENERSSVTEKCLEALQRTVFQLQNCQRNTGEGSRGISNGGEGWNGSTLTAVALSIMVLTAPTPIFQDSWPTFSDSARADQLGQLRQAASLFEKVAEGLAKVRFDGIQVLDKAVTVVTGSTLIDPELLDKEVDSILSGKKDIREELRNGITTAVQNSWSTVIDVVTNFNPVALSESAGASISTFLESGVERVAAFELSALVSLGERWLILTPLLVIPMAWEMKRQKKRNSERELRGQEELKESSEQAQIRGQKVKRELERIELRTILLDAVTSLGKLALQPPNSTSEAGLIRRRIKDILDRLEELKPSEDPVLPVSEFTSAIPTPGNDFSYLPPSPTVDGDWHLIYVSQTNNRSSQQELPQFPGIGVDNIRQKVWQVASSSSSTSSNNVPSPVPLLTRNTAELRFGPLGVFEVSVQGSWENLKDGERALLSFDTIFARPVELLGVKFSDDIPELNISLPPTLQQQAEWTVTYVDNHVRISRGSQGQLFLFRKVE